MAAAPVTQEANSDGIFRFAAGLYKKKFGSGI